MAKHSSISPENRSWENFEGDLPRPIKVLVYHRKAAGGSYHAYCIQYAAIYARADTEAEAVDRALEMLLHYLFDCYEDDIPTATRSVEQMFLDAFDFGKPRRDLANRLKLPVRVSTRERAAERRLLEVRDAEAQFSPD